MVSYRGNDVLGGPAVCEAPAGSRSDKRLRRARSIEKQTRTPEFAQLGRRFDMEPAWRGLLSLRDPTALTGRSGHPVVLRPEK